MTQPMPPIDDVEIASAALVRAWDYRDPHAQADAKAVLDALTAAGRLLPESTTTHTEWTWKHNNYVSTGRATTDRADAERAIAILQRNNGGDPVALMRREVTDWTPAEATP